MDLKRAEVVQADSDARLAMVAIAWHKGDVEIAETCSVGQSRESSKDVNSGSKRSGFQQQTKFWEDFFVFVISRKILRSFGHKIIFSCKN